MKVQGLILRVLAVLTIATFVMAPINCSVQWPPENTDLYWGVAIAQ